MDVAQQGAICDGAAGVGNTKFFQIILHIIIDSAQRGVSAHRNTKGRSDNRVFYCQCEQSF